MGKKSKNKSKQNNKKKSELQQQQAQGRTGQDTTAAAAAPSEIDAPEDPLFHLLSKENADLLADKLLAPHRRHGLEPHLQDKDALSSYLYDVFYVSADYFAERLINGLYDETGDSMMWRFKMNKEGDEFTLLAIVCQWKFFHLHHSWKGKGEMVKIVLAHPKVSVNELMPNRCNAAFLAAKYGDAKTLQYLIDAGCDLSQKDKYGTTLLCSAVEYPDPDVLRIVIKHVSPFEKRRVTDPETGEVAHLTAVDQIFNHYAGNGPISWQMLGSPPPVEKAAECFIMLRKCGVEMTNHPLMTHLTVISLCFDSVAEAKSRGIRYAEDLWKLGMCMIGLWFPPIVQDQIDTYDIRAEVDVEQNLILECFLCNEEIDKRTKLYCGHTFCRDCILEYGKANSKCPVCCRQLCLDVSPNRDLQTRMNSDKIEEIKIEEMRSNDGNIERDWYERHVSLIKNLFSLSNEQVMTEAEELGLHTENVSRDDLYLNFVRLIEDGHFHYYKSGFEKSSMTITESSSNEGARVGEQVSVGAPVLETSASKNLAMRESIAIAPKAGPVWVEIKVKGIPILASISNNSRYTIVSPKFREIFSLKKIPNLTTKKLRGFKSRIGRAVCLEEFSFDFGGIEIKLRNAMECESFGVNKVGIQLGQDFLLSGRYCILSANISDDDSNSVFYVADGTCSWIAFQKSESLRYYSFDGAIIKKPLFHFKTSFHNEQLLIASVTPDYTILECSYCCRTFPAWKRSNCCDDVYYCDERCQKASRKIHKIRKPGCAK